jgi:hypothetical protein
MNNERRKKIDKAIVELETAKLLIEELQAEEQDSYDNMPEGLQASDRGVACEAAAEALGDAASAIDEAREKLDEAKGE